MESAQEIIGYIELQRKKLQENIITNIASKGLHASTGEQRLASYDEKRNTKLFLYLVAPKLKIANETRSPHPFFGASSVATLTDGASPNAEDVFSRLTHKPVEGIWPITLERSFMSENPQLDRYSDRGEWEDRLNSSLVFILKYPDEAPQELASARSLRQMSQGIYEYQSDKIFNKEQIIAILAPSEIAKICRKVFNGIPIYNVSSCTQQIKIPSLGFMANNNEYLIGPDYASTMKKLDEEGKLPSKFSCHVSRLPSRQDLLKFPHYRTQLSLESMLEKYQTKDVNVVFRRIAAGWGSREDLMFLVSVATGLNINGQSSNGFTAMHYALDKNNIEMMQELLKLKVKLDIPNKEGKTALHIAESKSIKLDDLLNGNHDKRVFKERALANLAADPMLRGDPGFLASMQESAGKHYKPRWL